MGNWLSNSVKAVGKAVTDTGHAAGKVASNPWVQGALAAGLAATGVGAPAAAAIMAATKGGGALLKPGGNIGQGLTGAASGAAMGYGAGTVGQALKTGGIKAVGKMAMSKALGGVGGGGAPTVAHGGGSESDPYGDGHPEIFDPSAVPGASGGGWMDTVGSFLGNHGMDIAKGALGAGAAYEGYKNNQQANNLTKDALSHLNANPQAPDLSPIFADPGNPYARNRKIPVVGRL